MTHNKKTLAIMGWAAALGKDFSKATPDRLDHANMINEFRVAGKDIHDAALAVIKLLPKVKFKGKQKEDIKEMLCWLMNRGSEDKKNIIRLEVTIALLLACCEEIHTHIKNDKKKKAVAKLIDTAFKMQQIIDPNFEGTNHYIRADYAFQQFCEI